MCDMAKYLLYLWEPLILWPANVFGYSSKIVWSVWHRIFPISQPIICISARRFVVQNCNSYARFFILTGCIATHRFCYLIQVIGVVIKWSYNLYVNIIFLTIIGKESFNWIAQYFYEKLPDRSETKNPCCAASSPYPINGRDFFLASFFDNPTGASFLPTICHINSNSHYP